MVEPEAVAFGQLVTIRLWLSHDAFQRNPQRFVGHFETALAIAIGALVASSGGEPHRGQQVPTFRSSITAVPIDVRVIDKDGKPIADLRQEDFTVLEDGVPQTIAHFAAISPSLRASS